MYIIIFYVHIKCWVLIRSVRACYICINYKNNMFNIKLYILLVESCYSIYSTQVDLCML